MGSASAGDIDDNIIASNDESIDVDNIETPVNEEVSISNAVENTDDADDGLDAINGSSSKTKLNANQLGADHDLSGSTFQDIQNYLNSGSVVEGDTIY